MREKKIQDRTISTLGQEMIKSGISRSGTRPVHPVHLGHGWGDLPHGQGYGWEALGGHEAAERDEGGGQGTGQGPGWARGGRCHGLLTGVKYVVRRMSWESQHDDSISSDWIIHKSCPLVQTN